MATALPTALVIEDDEDVARLLTAVLTQAGFEVVVAGDGESGVELVRTRRPVLTTVDVVLPGLDGLEATRRIRRFSDTYLVMVSALTQEDDILGGLAAGADDYVTKPFRPRELRARFGAVMRRPGRRLPPAGPAADAAASPAPAVPAPRAAPADSDEPEFGPDRVHFRGLDLDLEHGDLSVDGVPLPLEPVEFDLLEIMLYGGWRARSAAELALDLRGEDYPAGSTVPLADRERVVAFMTALLRRLDERDPGARWVRALPEERYQLVPPDSQG